MASPASCALNVPMHINVQVVAYNMISVNLFCQAKLIVGISGRVCVFVPVIVCGICAMVFGRSLR